MILESIAKAMKRLGKSRYRISKETGVDQAVLCRIASYGSRNKKLRSKKGCTVKTADKLCKYLGLELKPRAKKRRAK